MRLRTLLSFFTWVVEKFLQKVYRLNGRFQEHLEAEFFVTFFLWFVFTGVLEVVALLSVGLIYLHDGTAQDLVSTFVITGLISTAYLVTNGIMVLWSAFTRERERVFNILKDSK